MMHQGRAYQTISPKALVAALLLTLGCTNGEPQPVAPTQPEAADLRVLVVGDPQLARQIGRLRGEWQAQTGRELTVVELDEPQLAASNGLAADAVIYPSAWIGELAERNLIRSLPAASETGSRDESQVLDLIRTREVQWGGEPWAVPFGSPVFVLWYRPDVLDGRSPPTTWSEYQRLSKQLSEQMASDDSDSPMSPTLEPLAPGWAARVFLARAAAYAKHRDYYGALFNLQDMRPLIQSEPFVRALEELVEITKLTPQDELSLDPEGVAAEFLAGRSAMAISWPTPAAATDRAAEIDVRFATLPGSQDVFNPELGDWQRRSLDESKHVSLLSVSGRLGSVTASTANPHAAALLLRQLSEPPWAEQVVGGSRHTTLYRRDQLSNPGQWVNPGMPPDAARSYAEAVESSLIEGDFLFCLRIAGHTQYLAALDQAVRAAVEGNKTPAKALEEAAAAWAQITGGLDAGRQRAAYHRSLGLESPQGSN